MASNFLPSLAWCVFGAALWKLGSLMESETRKEPEMPPENREHQYEVLRGELVRLTKEVGSLPAVPNRRVEFEGWFKDVKKRIEMRSERWTLIEHVEIAKRFNDLHSQWLQLARTDYELSRVNARAEVEDAKIKLELKQIEVEMARLDSQLKDLRQERVAKPTPSTEEDRLRTAFQRANTIAALHRIQAEELARYADDPEMRDIITRITDDERVRILEGRK